MNRIRPVFATLVLIAALSGCGQKTEQLAETSSDSLLASSPVEQPAGNLSPQADYQSPPVTEAPPAETPAPPRKTSKPKASTPSRTTPAEKPGVTLSEGTPIPVTVGAQISSETANAGDAWSGTVKENVIVGDRVVIPAGSTVEGVVSGVHPAQKGTRAFLVLAVTSVVVDGKSVSVSAGTDSIIAGSTRARNLGAIAGGAAAGALIGKAVGGSGKGALIGGLVGGAAATGAVAASKGYQVVVKEGTNLTFAVNHDVKMPS